jgi:hypothetical protein
MKQIINTLVICLAITTVNASPSFINPIAKYKDHTLTDNANDRGRNGLAVNPNPKTGDIQVNFKATKAGKATIVVLDESGTIVLQQKVQLVAGKNNININNFNELAEGDYTVCLNTYYGSYSAPFLLWK